MRISRRQFVVVLGALALGTVEALLFQRATPVLACAGLPSADFHRVTIEQAAMRPYLLPRQSILVLRSTEAELRRGDVVAIDASWLGLDAALRVVGLAGEQIELRNGRVWVDGTALAEPYLERDVRTESLHGTARWSVPAGRAFVLGDNRAVAADSREFGPIPLSVVRGRVVGLC